MLEEQITQWRNYLRNRQAIHAVEAIFKGLARALREALSFDPRGGGLPSVKGAL